MKIMFVAPHIYPALGGVERYILTLCEAYKKHHEIIIVASSPDVKQPTKTFRKDGTCVYMLPVTFRLSNTPIGLSWRKQIKRIIAETRPDIINAHSPVPFMADMAVLAAGNTPIVLTYHSGSMLKGGGLVDIILGTYEKLALPRIFRMATRIVAIYPDFVRRLIDDSSKIEFIPPGIDTEYYRPEVQEKIYDVSYVGRIEETSRWKGISVLIEATAIAARHRPALNVCLIGDGDAVEAYRQQVATLGIEKHVIFAGALKGEALVRAYNESRIIALPSLTESESFGMVLAEAMSCGVPVIGSRIGGIPNVIDDGVNGRLVTPNDPAQLADAMIDMLQDEKRLQEWGKMGREKVRQSFSIQQQIDTTMQLFEQVRTHA